MKKVYEINRNNVVEDIRKIADFTPDEIVMIYDFIYTDKKGYERKINIAIQKNVMFNGKDFFYEYQTEVRTYVNNDKEDYYYIEYKSFDDEDGKEFGDMKESRNYNIDFIFGEINKFVNR